MGNRPLAALDISTSRTAEKCGTQRRAAKRSTWHAVAECRPHARSSYRVRTVSDLKALLARPVQGNRLRG
jgi:hypothetical protein